MAGNDVYLRTVPSDADPDDVRLYDPTAADAGGGTVNATFNVTIDAVTLAAEADLLIQATANQTIDAVTLSSSADLLVQATAAQTLENVTLSASADLLIAGSLTATIDPVTLAAEADVLLAATGAQTLDPVTLNATGALIIQGTFGQTLDAVTLDASGELSGGVEVPTDRGGDDGGGYVRQRRKYKYVTAQKLQELLDAEEARKAPEPTHKRLRKVKREIVAQIEAAGLLGPARPAVARLVQQELVREYVPDMDWRALANAVADIMRKAAEEAARLEQEIEDEDEDFLILMAA